MDQLQARFAVVQAGAHGLARRDHCIRAGIADPDLVQGGEESPVVTLRRRRRVGMRRRGEANCGCNAYYGEQQFHP